MHSKCLFNKRGLIPKNSLSGNTLYLYVEKIVFSPQWGKMSFTGGIIGKIWTLILSNIMEDRHIILQTYFKRTLLINLQYKYDMHDVHVILFVVGIRRI